MITKSKKLMSFKDSTSFIRALLLSLSMLFIAVTSFGQTGLKEGPTSLKEGSNLVNEGSTTLKEASSSVSKEEPTTVNDDGKGATTGKHHVFPRLQCTWYSANTFYERTGQPITFGGNANSWYTNAEKAGYRVSKSTAAITRNSILVFGGGRYGHVVIVEKVDFARGTIELSESNWIPLTIGKRTIKFSDLKRLGFIGLILPPSKNKLPVRRWYA